MLINTRYRQFNLRAVDVFYVYAYIAIFIILVKTLPNKLIHPDVLQGAFVIGALGTWRWGWWLLNYFRSLYFANIKFPRMRKAANEVWDAGWRPNHVHYLMTTFYENPDTTDKFLQSIVREVKSVAVPSTLWVGLGAKYDEDFIRKWFAKISEELPLEVVFLHQNQPGKRAAIGLLLRALSRHGVGDDDYVFLMDGDSIMNEGAVRKTLSVFAAYPKFTAITTDEEVVMVGPEWTEKWLTLRFAQRRMWMQSHAVSDKVLTLTGRMSAFRAKPITEKEFIRNMEADHLYHWFWGSFRFLSGDDKSTWYTLLKNGHNMTFLPDVMVYTIEYIDGYGVKRARDNLVRWSGNMLRNGMRAIMLGPRKVGLYVWWCLIDQRLNIWTSILGFCTAISVSIFIESSFIFTYLLWVMFTRFIVGATLWTYSDRIRISYPFILYVNQLTTAFIKFYIMFRLPVQSWANRMAQKSGHELLKKPLMRIFPVYMTCFYFTVLIFGILLLAGILKLPNISQIL